MRQFELWRGRCPGCAKSFVISPELAGKLVRCVQCKLSFEIPTNAPNATPRNLVDHLTPCTHCGEFHYAQMSTCPRCGELKGNHFQSATDHPSYCFTSDASCVATPRILIGQSATKLSNHAGELLATRSREALEPHQSTRSPKRSFADWLKACCYWILKKFAWLA